MDTLTYTGTFLKQPALNLEVYDPSPELVEAVNLALLVEQPLLLMGEPGSGKTRLAEAVAAELHGENYKNHYFRWDIKSTSTAKEGIYQYDALKRMYDVNAQSASARKIRNYISYGKFAEALTEPQNGNLPNILLIDEIDKAGIDFPNDLLLEIEKKEFFIPELNERIEASSKVLIFITSNRERELPPAFLRRCLYHYIKFPAHDDLTKIIHARFGQRSNEKLVTNAVHLFLDIRAKIEAQFAENEKKPATSELLDWFRVVNDRITRKDKLTGSEKKELERIEKYEKGKLDENTPIPFRQALLKTWESNQLFKTT
ncbi:MAG: MoxR family ATPase [Chitinophagaceae bacterium]